MKYLLLITCILCFFACETLNYIELSNYQKSFLYYSGGEKFSLVKNQKDTIHFKVVKKNTDDLLLNDNPSDSVPKGYLEFERISLTKSEYTGRIGVNGNDGYSFSFKGKGFAYRDSTGQREIPMLLDSLIYIGETTLNSIAYNNVYFIYDNCDSLYFSKEKGIIQIKFGKEKITYDLID